MFKNETKNRVMSFAVIAMIMLSAIGICLSGDIDADSGEYGTDSFNIHMTTADTFTYKPSSNISGTTFTVEGTATAAGAGSSYGTGTGANGGTALEYTFKPAAVANKVATITANHAATGQNVVQTINFTVYNSLSISGDGSKTISANTPSGSNVATYTVSGLAATVDDLSISSQKLGGNDVSAFTLTGGVLKTSGTLTAGSYTIVLSLTDTVGGESNANTLTKTTTKTVTVVVNAASDFNVTPATVNTYVNDARTANTDGKIITFNGTNISSIDNPKYTISGVTTSISGTEAKAKGVFGIGSTETSKDIEISSGNPTLTLVTTGIANSDITGENVDHIVIGYTVTLTGTSNGVAITPVSHDYTVNFYKALAFTTTPVLNNANSFTNSNNGLDVIMAINTSGANIIKYSWGDGTFTKKAVLAEKDILVTANHTYAKEGSYVITITAANDFEETSYITPYTTGSFIGFVDDEKTLQITKISATESEDSLILNGNVLVTEGYTPTYKWSYSIDGAEAVELTSPGTPEWVTGIDGKKLTLNKSAIPDNTKFTLSASVLFDGNTEQDTKTASYTYNDTSFFGVHGWIFIIFAILAIAFAVAYFYFGVKTPVVMAGIIISVILVILCFIYKDFGGIIDAISGIFSKP